MSDRIHLLSDDIANKIAAGEVVVRPAAVVKELLENAVDAQAKEIHLIIKDGGKSLIQVIDNGLGMSETDARMAFERHATSKINTIDDLFSINTMGFRGEALPSIAAVSKVHLKTKQAADNVGTELRIEGSDFVDQQLCQTNVGCNFTIKSLFYNVPARRKFLKSDHVETKHIIEEFVRISLSHPEIKLQMHSNDKEIFHLPAQSLRKRIASVLSNKLQERIIKVEEQTDIVSIHGYIGKPEFAKKSRGEQYFFINSRYIKSSYLNHAILKAYDDFLDAKEYPLYVLNLTIDPARIDINVHPSKHEVKFEDERHIYQILSAAVRHALSKFAVTPTLDFDIDPSFNRHEFFKEQKPVNIENSINKGKESTFLNRQTGSANSNENWQELYKFSTDEQQKIEYINQQSTFSKLTQIHTKYILAEIEDGFLLVDQRRAHQRVLYEMFLTANQVSSQKLLFPETIELTHSLITIFTNTQQELHQRGLEAEVFGQNAIVVHATPADLPLSNIQEFIETLLMELSMNENMEANQAIAKHMALYGAMRHGQRLSIEEMQALYAQLMQCKQKNYGIRKDKTYIHFSFEELTNRFPL